MLAVWAILRSIPLLGYACLTLFLAAMAERHEVHVRDQRIIVITATNANEKTQAAEAAASEAARLIAAQRGEVDEANKRAAVAAADAANSAAATARVQSALAATRRRLGPGNGAAGSPAELEATRAAVGVLADLLGERQRTGAIRSRYADEAAAAGAGCERQYNALTPPDGTGLKR